VSSGYEPGLYWWNAQDGARVRVQNGHGVAVHEICFSKDGRLVASAAADKTVRLWNGTNGSLVRALPIGSIVYAVALSPDGRLVAAGSFDGLVRLWDTSAPRSLLTLLALPGPGEQGDWLALTPEGFLAGSPGLAQVGQWRMAGQQVAAEPVWQALQQPDAVARAARGEKLKDPTFK
jgi:WD40 repeat protein